MGTRQISAVGSGVAPTRRSGQYGFTLLELMVALAIIVLIAGSLPFALDRLMPARRVSSAAERLIADLRYLQDQTMARGSPGHLSFDRSGYRLTLAAGFVDRRVELPDSIQLSLAGQPGTVSSAQLTVYPDGSSTPVEILLNDSGRLARVKVSMLTGRAYRAPIP